MSRRGSVETIRPLTAVVTGASRGLGREIADRLVGQGWNVAMLARGEEELRATATGIGGEPYVCDVTDLDQVSGVAAEIVSKHPMVELLVNNAGKGLGKNFLEAEDAEIRAIFDLNFMGAINVTRALAQAMERGRPSDLVNIVSAAANNPLPTSEVYTASKAALLGLDRAMTPGLKRRGVNVHSILAGFFDSTGFPQNDETLPPDFRNPFMKTTAGEVADAVIDRLGKRPSEITIPKAYRVTAIAGAIAPRLSAEYTHRRFSRGNYRPAA